MTTPQPAVRPAQESDVGAVAALWRACALTTDYNDPQADFAFALNGPSSTVLVAETCEGGIVGSIMAGHDGHRGWLYYVAVAPMYRSQGLGRTLVAAGEDWLREHGVAKVQLMVRPANRGVTDFYAMLGYEDMPRILMGKMLKSN
ncbi:GNAT family acetyltransferase [Stakelama sp. CBK3Z-3]|uniref:GNAT family acetyltransferase n=1 Tax=Stakelama flava TaxID=2860338 RepID=A0ABS6XLE1_9SPHN|nr:GNAT family acetyltransferase [Stakelama flava]MBW4330966.1 GNAT family acetyltransferase [Stakelama flava]